MLRIGRPVSCRRNRGPRLSLSLLCPTSLFRGAAHPVVNIRTSEHQKEPNDWLPEKFGLQIGDQYIALKVEELVPLREQLKKARVQGEAFVEFGEGKVRIPVTAEAEELLSKLLGVVKPETDHTKQPDSDGKPEPISDEKHVLIVEENFDKAGFSRKVTPRAGPKPSFPAAIRPILKKHQQSGLAWLQSSWASGYPGVLLADDMGLGKTLQALSFLAWLREISASVRQSGGQKGPVIIVAPTGLLANWEKEHNLDLHDPGLGDICRAYGRHLKTLKISSTRDIDRGAPSLDQRRIQQADWVLTTYETLRDYHMSFATIPFVCAVFDEMQKIKSATSLLTRTAKTVNANFTIGLTGTPIENQVSDLWCIMDIVHPGYLGDLKSFSAKYHPDDEGALEQLHSMLLGATAEGHAPMLRRMKADELEGLPENKFIFENGQCRRRKLVCMPKLLAGPNNQNPDQCLKLYIY